MGDSSLIPDTWLHQVCTPKTKKKKKAFAHHTLPLEKNKTFWHLPMELLGPCDLVYDKNAAKKNIDDKSSALPTTPVTWKRMGWGNQINEQNLEILATKRSK